MVLHSLCCLAVITLAISIGIGTYLAHSHWYLKKDAIGVKLLKEQFNELINEKSQTNRDQILNYFQNDISNIEEFDSSLLKIDKK